MDAFHVFDLYTPTVLYLCVCQVGVALCIPCVLAAWLVP